MWSKFEHLYQDIDFMRQNTIFIQSSNKTAADFKNVAHFANSLKCNSI